MHIHSLVRGFHSPSETRVDMRWITRRATSARPYRVVRHLDADVQLVLRLLYAEHHRRPGPGLHCNNTS
jgi:hypothetical protein